MLTRSGALDTGSPGRKSTFVIHIRQVAEQSRRRTRQRSAPHVRALSFEAGSVCHPAQQAFPTKTPPPPPPTAAHTAFRARAARPTGSASTPRRRARSRRTAAAERPGTHHAAGAVARTRSGRRPRAEAGSPRPAAHSSDLSGLARAAGAASAQGASAREHRGW